MKITMTGKLYEIGQARIFGKFVKRTAVLEVPNGKYPAYYPFVFKGDAVAVLDGFAQGDEVSITGYLNGRKYQKKDANGVPTGNMMYFLEIAATTIQRGSVAPEGEGCCDEAEGDADNFPY